jgi:L-methionine (R)-S-oxide reductase
MKRYRSALALKTEIGRLLAEAKPRKGKDSAPERVVELLYEGRHYFWIGIYLVLGEQVVRQVFRGPVAPCHSFAFGKGNVGTTGQKGIMKVIPDVSTDATYSMCFLETKSEIVVPIKIAGRTLGVIDVESDRPNAFGGTDRVLLKNVALALARFFTSNGRYLVREARRRQVEAAPPSPVERGHQPASDRSAVEAATRRAAAGEKSR